MKKYLISEYFPHKGQAKLHNVSKSESKKEILVISSIRSGKSFGIIHDVIISAWNNTTPHGVLVCAPTFRLLESVLEREIVGRLQSFGLLKSHSFSRHESELQNGKKIFYRSLDDPDYALRGLNIYKAYVDECAYTSKYAIDLVKGRLLTTNGQLVMITTPAGFSNWVYEDYIVKKRNDVEYIQFNILDNPIITQEAVDRLKASYDELMFRQEILGEFVNLYANQVYYSFTEENVIEEFQPDPFVPIYVGLDFNIDKNAWIAIQKRPDNTFVAFAEGYGARTTYDVADQLLARFGRENLIVVPDATGRNKLQGVAITNFDLLRQAGIHNIVENKSNPDRLKRYSIVNATFKNALGQKRLFLLRKGCPETIRELYDLSYKKNSTEIDDVGGTKGHRTDALGYVTVFATGNEVGRIINKNDDFVREFMQRAQAYQDYL